MAVYSKIAISPVDKVKLRVIDFRVQTKKYKLRFLRYDLSHQERFSYSAEDSFTNLFAKHARGFVDNIVEIVYFRVVASDCYVMFAVLLPCRFS